VKETIPKERGGKKGAWTVKKGGAVPARRKGDVNTGERPGILHASSGGKRKALSRDLSRRKKDVEEGKPPRSFWKNPDRCRPHTIFAPPRKGKESTLSNARKRPAWRVPQKRGKRNGSHSAMKFIRLGQSLEKTCS